MLQHTPVPDRLLPDNDRRDSLVLARERLAKAIRIGMVRGVVGLIGPSAPWSQPDGTWAGLARELAGQDILVVATGRAVRAMDAAGLLDPSALEAAGSGLAEFCALCDLPPVVPWPGSDAGALGDLCARLAEAFAVPAADLPVIVCGPDRLDLPQAGPDTLTDPLVLAESDPSGAAAAIGRRITAKRLALGLNDRFDGSVYS